LRGLWVAATVYNPGELVGYDNDLYQDIYAGLHTAASTNTPGTGGTKNLANAAVTDAGSGKVDIPCTSHGIAVGSPIVISGTVHYDGEYTVLSGSATSKIRIIHAYTAETLAGTETVTYNGAIYWAKRVEGLSTDQLAALAGTSGTVPSGSNKFVDNADLRLKQDIATLTDAAEVTAPFGVANNFELIMTAAVGASRTLKNPTELTVGQSGFIDLVQSSAGGNSVVFDTYYVFPNATDPTQDTTASTTSTLVYVVKSPTEIHCQYLPKWGRTPA
jgi:hypothetical protein